MSYEVPIERGKVREFARATKSRNAAYTGPNPIVPPTFLTTAGHFWAHGPMEGAADLGFELVCTRQTGGAAITASAAFLL